MLLRVVVVFHANLVFPRPVPAVAPEWTMAPGNITPSLVPIFCDVAGKSLALNHWRLNLAFMPPTGLPSQAMGTAGNREKPPLTT